MRLTAVTTLSLSLLRRVSLILWLVSVFTLINPPIRRDWGEPSRLFSVLALQG